MEAPDLAPAVKKKALKLKPSGGRLADPLIITAFTVIIISLVFNWASDYIQPPAEDEFSEYSDPNNAYQIALDEHQDRVRAFEGIFSLFYSVGSVLLVWGLFYKTVSDSEDLPEWVRVAMMIGVFYFMIRLFTSELSLTETFELMALIGIST